MTELNVLFLNPPWLVKGREGVRAGSRWPYTVKKLEQGDTIPFPFNLAYSAALLRKKGIEVEAIDGIASRIDLKQFFNELKKKNPDLIVMETSTPSYPYDREIAREIKEEFNDSKMVFSGTHATVFPETVLRENEFLDFVLLGEFEYTLNELVERLNKKEKLKDIKGIAFKEKTDIAINERRSLITDLDELPFPARDLFPIYNYNDCFPKFTPNIQLVSSRGCIYRCPFCVWPNVMYGGQNYRKRKAVKVAEEIEQILLNYKFKELYFDDDTFNIDKEHVESICNELKNRSIEIPWSCMCHSVIKRETLEAMHSAGCEGIKFGVETGNEKILKSLGKGTTKEIIKRTITWCRELGIRTHATFTLGLPGETRETIEETKQFVFELNPDSVQFSITIPFPGTRFYSEAKEKGWLLTEDWTKYDGNNVGIIKTQYMSPEFLEDSVQELKEAWSAHAFARSPYSKVRHLIQEKGLKGFFCSVPSYSRKFISRRKKLKKYKK